MASTYSGKSNENANQKTREGVIHIGKMLDRWRSIGCTWGLLTDADIARFLVKHYEETWLAQQSVDCCVQCRTPLTLTCPYCSSPSASRRSVPTITTITVSSSTSSSVPATSTPNLGEVADTDRTDSACKDTEKTDVNKDARGRKTKKTTVAPPCNRMPENFDNKCDENYDGDNDRNEASNGDEKAEELTSSTTVIHNQDKLQGSTSCEVLSDLRTSVSEELKCVLCTESFTRPDPLTLHMHAHSAEMMYQCDLCTASFLFLDVLQRHKLAHESQKQETRLKQTSKVNIPTLRGECQTRENSRAVAQIQTQNTFNSDSNYRQNTINQTDIYVKESRVSKNENRELDLQEQNSDIYSGDTDIESDAEAEASSHNDCRQNKNNPSSMTVGQGCMDASPGDNGLDEKNCSQQSKQNVCSDQYFHSNSESISGRLRNSEKIDVYGCQHCGQSFRSLDGLLTHARIHYINRTSLKCFVCMKTFFSASLLKRHQCQGSKHKEIHLNRCKQCNVEFSTAADLAQHEQNHSTKLTRSRKKMSAEKSSSKITDEKHECEICSVLCSTTKELQHHKLAKHEGQSRKFQCGQCGKVLCNMQTLVTHERTHTGDKPCQCPFCPSTFRSNSNLRAHLRTHTGHTPYLCPQCGRGFKEITHLKRHLVSHSGEKPHQCQLCGKAYVHATSLKEHMLTHSAAPKTWVCHQCGKAFINSKKLKVHLKTHTDKGEARSKPTANKRYACQTCGATYQQASSLSRHKKLHEEGATQHTCLECGKIFRDKYELKKHCALHTGLTPYQCKLCLRSFRDSSSHKRHLLSHSGAKPHVCPKCNKSYAGSKALKRHLQVHTGVRPLTCPQCLKTFFTPWTLHLHVHHHSNHNNTKSPSEKSHVCHQCGASYLRASSLVRHQRLHEPGQEQSSRYQCSQCSRLFGDSSHLKRHLLSHSGEKPFVCASCGKAYADSHTLKDHMQVHTGVRSFICEVCGKAFFSAKTLKEHARSHSDHRPFQCLQCSAAYKHLSGLISHRRLHSGARPFSCGECSKTFKDYTCYKRHQLTHSHHKPHVCQQCGKAYKDLKNLRHHQAQHHGSVS